MSLQKGISKIEIILVTVLIMLMGLSVFTLVVSSSNTYNKLIKERDDLLDLRILSSYIDNKIKQTDKRDLVQIKNNPINELPSILITESIDNDIYETWIYFSNNYVREAYIKKGIIFDDNMSFEIAQINQFEPSIINDVLIIDFVGNNVNEVLQKRQIKVNLKFN